MTTLIDHIASILATAGVGAEGAGTGWRVMKGETHSSPDTTITVKPAPGMAPNPKWRLDYPSIQLLVRSNRNDWNGGYTKALEAREALLGRPPETRPNGDRIVSITGIGDVAPLGQDENQRSLFSVNFQLIVEPGSSTHRDPL